MVPRAVPTSSARSRWASSPTSRCGGWTACGHAGIADPVAALVFGSRPPLAMLLVGGQVLVEDDVLLTADERDAGVRGVAGGAAADGEEGAMTDVSTRAGVRDGVGESPRGRTAR